MGMSVATAVIPLFVLSLFNMALMWPTRNHIADLNPKVAGALNTFATVSLMVCTMCNLWLRHGGLFYAACVALNAGPMLDMLGLVGCCFGVDYTGDNATNKVPWNSDSWRSSASDQSSAGKAKLLSNG